VPYSKSAAVSGAGGVSENSSSAIKVGVEPKKKGGEGVPRLLEWGLGSGVKPRERLEKDGYN